MKILIISPYYPPRGCARSLQIGKVVTAMESCGMQPIVIAGKDRDLSKSEPFPGKVYRVEHFKRPEYNHIIGKVATKLIMELYSCNPKTKFVAQAVQTGLKIIKYDQPDCILSSSTPFESHLAGFALAQETSLPWVASLSDPWPLWINPYPYNKNRIPIISEFQKYTLKKIINGCTAFHMPNQYAVKLIEKATEVNISNKAYVIPHVGNSPPSSLSATDYRGWIAHIGKLSRERISLPLLQAIKRSCLEIPEKFNGLLCVGDVCPEFVSIVSKLKLERYIRIIEPLPQKEAMEIANSVGALLVIEANMDKSPYLPSKFVDYVLTGKPIIAITPTESPIRDYLKNYSMGTAVSQNEQLIVNTIKRYWLESPGLNMNEDQKSKDAAIGELFSFSSVGNQYKSMFAKLKSIYN